MVKKVPAAAFDAAAVGYKEKGMRKGSITVFLSLMLSVMLTVVFMSVSVVKVSAGRMQLANAADQSLCLFLPGMTGICWRIMTSFLLMEASAVQSCGWEKP